MSRSHPLAALTRARLLEFVREPEALFWVFAFPLVMALVLGFAFRDKAPEPIPIGIAGEARASAIGGAPLQSPMLKTLLFPSIEEGRAALRMGKIALLVEKANP